MSDTNVHVPVAPEAQSIPATAWEVLGLFEGQGQRRKLVGQLSLELSPQLAQVLFYLSF